MPYSKDDNIDLGPPLGYAIYHMTGDHTGLGRPLTAAEAFLKLLEHHSYRHISQDDLAQCVTLATDCIKLRRQLASCGALNWERTAEDENAADTIRAHILRATNGA